MLNAGETKANLIIVFKFCCSHTQKKKKLGKERREQGKGKEGKETHRNKKKNKKKNPETY